MCMMISSNYSSHVQPIDRSPPLKHKCRRLRSKNVARRPLLADSGQSPLTAIDPERTSTKGRVDRKVCLFTSEASLHSMGKTICPFLSFLRQAHVLPKSYFAPTTRTGYQTRSSVSLDRSVHSTAGSFWESFEFQHRTGYRQREPNFSYFALVEVKDSTSALGPKADGEIASKLQLQVADM